MLSDFLEGEGDADVLEDFFLAVVEDEVELPPVDFLPVVVDVVFLVVAADECVVVVACSSLCAHETMKAVPATTAVKARSDFFIVKVNGSKN